MLAHLHPAKISRDRVTHYQPYEKELNVLGLVFPMKLSDIGKFERLNKLRINVFGFDDEEEEVVPLRLTKHEADFGQLINLLLIERNEKQHYCLITNFNGMMKGKRTKHGGTEYYCMNCLHGFAKKETLIKHEEHCKKNACQTLIFPEEDKCIIEFKSWAKQQRIPFIIYADFECFTEPCNDNDHNDANSESGRYQHHVPNSFGYIVVSSTPGLTTKPVIYRGENVVETFLKKIFDEERRIADILTNPKPLKLSTAEEMVFRQAIHCCICNQLLGSDRVRDHDHVSGDFRGAAHNVCNLQHRLKRKQNKDEEDSYIIPVVFHNLRGYDGHLIFQQLGKFADKIDLIPNTLEKYISFTVGNLRFIDSFQFMATSLEKLVGNLAAEGKSKFKTLCRFIPDAEKQDLLLRKGVYPYDYVCEASKFEGTSLPSKEQFYSQLSQQHISDANYAHAQHVWQTFGCNTLGDYHDLYLKSDVLQLADVFENFRDVCMTNYKLDPAHYYTAPGLSWDAMLRETKVSLQLITDIDMYLMVEEGIRGGISMISNKYAKANNPYVKDFNVTEPTSYISYLDANNLYGWAMSQPLPTGGFDWVEAEAWTSQHVLNIPHNSSKGYIFEVDLEYPAEIHDEHSDYPLAPEPLTVKLDKLSNYSQDLYKQLGLTGKASEKLIPNLHDKSKYVIHYVNLQQCLQLGLKLVKVHRVFEFNQSP